MTTSEVQRLFDKTLVGRYEDEEPWEAIRKLRRNGDRAIFEMAAEWLTSTDALKRARAADVLAQLLAYGTGDRKRTEPERLFRDETFPLLVQLLEGESNPMVLHAAITAFGHLDNEAAIPIIERYKDHPDQDVRFSVAFSLGNFPNNSLTISALIELTGDPDSDVRDWAVFGLGVQGDADSLEIREVLLRGVADSDEDVREEAAVGLGKRKDIRLLPALRSMLEEEGLKVRVAEAASALLGMPEDPEEWEAEDYKNALDEKFGRDKEVYS